MSKPWHINETPSGYVSMFDMLSPEVIKAQRMAELKDLAEWRRRHLQPMLDWSDPVKRQAMQIKAQAEFEEAREIVFKNPQKYLAEALAKNPYFLDASREIPFAKRWQNLKEIKKKTAPQPWWRRLLDRVFG